MEYVNDNPISAPFIPVCKMENNAAASTRRFPRNSKRMPIHLLEKIDGHFLKFLNTKWMSGCNCGMSNNTNKEEQLLLLYEHVVLLDLCKVVLFRKETKTDV